MKKKMALFYAVFFISVPVGALEDIETVLDNFFINSPSPLYYWSDSSSGDLTLQQIECFTPFSPLKIQYVNREEFYIAESDFYFKNTFRYGYCDRLYYFWWFPPDAEETYILETATQSDIKYAPGRDIEMTQQEIDQKLASAASLLKDYNEAKCGYTPVWEIIGYMGLGVTFGAVGVWGLTDEEISPIAPAALLVGSLIEFSIGMSAISVNINIRKKVNGIYEELNTLW